MRKSLFTLVGMTYADDGLWETWESREGNQYSIRVEGINGACLLSRRKVQEKLIEWYSQDERKTASQGEENA